MKLWLTIINYRCALKMPRSIESSRDNLEEIWMTLREGLAIPNRRLLISGDKEISLRSTRTNYLSRMQKTLKRKEIIDGFFRLKMIRWGFKSSALKMIWPSCHLSARESLKKFRVSLVKRRRCWPCWRKKKFRLTQLRDSYLKLKKIFISKNKNLTLMSEEQSLRTRIKVWLIEKRKQEFIKNLKLWKETILSSVTREKLTCSLSRMSLIFHRRKSLLSKRRKISSSLK